MYTSANGVEVITNNELSVLVDKLLINTHGVTLHNIPLITMASHRVDHMIDSVFYCGINTAVTLVGVFGNIVLIIIFTHPSILPHKSLFHTYLKVQVNNIESIELTLILPGNYSCQHSLPPLHLLIQHLCMFEVQ